MTNWLVPKNNTSSILASSITAVSSSLVVKTGEGSRFPSTYPFRITTDNEIMECTNRVNDTLSITRAREGTFAAAHSSGAAVRLNMTADVITQIEVAIDSMDSAKIPAALVDARGDILCGSAPDTPARLPVGSNGQLLMADSAQTLGIRWTTIAGSLITTGTYTGNNTQNRAIPHSLGTTPKVVFIFVLQSSSFIFGQLIPDIGYLNIPYQSGAVTVMDSSNLYVGTVDYHGNSSSYSYRWVALA